MPKLSIVCALWNGEWKQVGKNDNRLYSPIYVERLKDMLEKKTSHEFDFVCLSNLPASDFRDDIIVVPLKETYPAWWSRIEIFNPDLELNERVLAMDIDVLVVKNIDPIIDYPADFVVHNVWSYSTHKNAETAAARAMEKRGCRLIPHYGLDMMVFDRGARPQLYTEFDAKYIDDLCGIQDWMSVCLGQEEERFPKGWGRKLNKGDRGDHRIRPGKAKTIACHPIKNHLLAENGYTYADKLWKGEL